MGLALITLRDLVQTGLVIGFFVSFLLATLYFRMTRTSRAR